jgi:hypothetical protein
MSSSGLEAFLARLYVDAKMRARFRAEPKRVAAEAGLSEEDCESLKNIDWVGLALASRSFERKRSLKKKPSLISRLFPR